jgi:integrase
MARPRKDGKPPKPVSKRKLSPLFVVKKNLPPGLTWDTDQKGLVLCTHATGHKSYKVIYSFHGRPRWLTIADATAIGLADARKHARRIMNDVAEGKDPAAERKAERMAGSFEELAQRYVAEWASKRNKSYKQAEALVQGYVLPRLGKLKPADITRADVKAMLAQIAAPVLMNQVLGSASAIFSWAVKQEIVTTNPCRLIDRNETRSRERVLSDSETPVFWDAFDNAGVPGMALKLILLLGQRPGEVCHMRREHLVDGWWTLPGEPDAEFGWMGTKNGASHRVWLPAPAQKIVAELGDGTTGFVLTARRGRPIGRLDEVMRQICSELGVTDGVTPHDLRRTHGSTITRLGFGREAMNRVQNHKEGGISSVYDRHQYGDENKRIMEAVAAHMMALAEGKPGDSKVVRLTRT